MSFVVLHHFFPRVLPGGFIGVDVFFVLSGYFITYWLLRRVDLNWRNLIRQFFYRRVLRLIPGLIFMLAGVFGLSLLLLLPIELRYFGKHAVAALLGAANVTLWTEGGYFDQPAADKPLLHLWSLGVEEQFYLFWPFIFVLGVQFALRVKLPFRIVLAGTGFLVFLASLGLSVWLTPIFPNFAFFMVVTRAWELVAGAIMAILLSARRPHFLPATATRLVWGAALAGLIVTALTITPEDAFPGALALAPVVTACVAIVAGENLAQETTTQTLAGWTVRFLGDISYGLYLWHWPLLVLAELASESPLTVLAKFLVLSLALVMACLSTYGVESRFLVSTGRDY